MNTATWASFDAARKNQELAATTIAAGQSNSSAEIRDSKAAAETVERLQRETAELRALAAKSLFGGLPLIRAFGIRPDEDDEYQVFSDSTRGMAERRAMRDALTKIAKGASSDPLHVVLLVPGETIHERTEGRFARLVDSEAPESFAHIADVRLYSGALRAELDPMPAWDSPDPAIDAICRQFLKRIHPEKAPRSVMLVMVREFTDESNGDYWVQAQQRTFSLSTLEKAEDDPEKLEADKVRVADAFAHDRSRFTIAIWGGCLLMFVVALVCRAALSMRTAREGGWPNWLAIPTFGFLLGLILTPLIMLALKRGLPDPRSDVLASAWWPCAAGAFSLIFPAAIFRMAVGSAGRNIPSISCHGRWGIAFVSVRIGDRQRVWIQPATYALGAGCIHLIAAMSISAALLVYCFGRAIDLADHFPLSILPITLCLSLVFGAGAFLGSPWVLWGDRDDCRTDDHDPHIGGQVPRLDCWRE